MVEEDNFDFEEFAREHLADGKSHDWKSGKARDTFTKKKGWFPGSIENPVQPRGGRGLKTYEDYFGFNRKELEGKNVLDLGVGPEAKFAKELAEAGISTKVVGLSPDFVFGRYREKIKKSFREAKLTGGLGQVLPFESESFDIVVALHLLLEVLPSDKNIFEEIARVLRKGGVGYIGPVLHRDRRVIEDNEGVINYLAQRGVSVSFEAIPLEIFKTKFYDESTGYGVGYVGGYRVLLKKSLR